jgi:hypothetical protein
MAMSGRGWKDRAAAGRSSALAVLFIGPRLAMTRPGPEPLAFGSS